MAGPTIRGPDWVKTAAWAGLAAVAMIAAWPVAAAEDHPPKPSVFEIQALYDMGTCLARRQPEGLRVALDPALSVSDSTRALHKLAKGYSRCYAGRVKVSPALLAGAAAEGMLRIDYGVGVPLAKLMPSATPVAARSKVEGIALCMVLTHPEDASRLLATDPTSGDGAHALRSFAEMLPGCVEQGETFQLNAMGLRAVTALAAYRLVSANAEVSS